MEKKEIKMSVGLFYMLIGTIVVFAGVIIIGFLVVFNKKTQEIPTSVQQEQSQTITQNMIET